MPPARSPERSLVLIGGGHCHALVLRLWGRAPLAGVAVTLISPARATPYTGMLPGHVAGHYPRGALDIDLQRLAGAAGARLILGQATDIDRAARCVRVAGHAPVAYDIAALNIGATAAMPDLPGFAAHGVPVKPPTEFADRWDRFLGAAAQGQTAPDVAVIGGGVAGAELATAMAHRLRAQGMTGARLTVIEAQGVALAGVAPAARAVLLAQMARLGVNLITGARVLRVEAGAVLLADGQRITVGLTLGAAGVRAPGWLAATGLHLTNGFVTTRPTLQSLTDDAIFATGDCAHMQDSPRPKAGVFAVRQAPVLAANLRAALTGAALRRYAPQHRYLRLISTGGKQAVTDWAGFGLHGVWLWHLKDRIDRRFMRHLSAPPLPELPH